MKKTLGPDNSELCPIEGARQRTSPSRPTSSPAQEQLTWRRGAAARTAEGAAAAASPECPWSCGFCAGQVRLASAQAKLLRLWPRRGTRRAGERRLALARGKDRAQSLPLPAPPRVPVPPPLASAPRGTRRFLRTPQHPVVAPLRSLSLEHSVLSPLLARSEVPQTL